MFDVVAARLESIARLLRYPESGWDGVDRELTRAEKLLADQPEALSRLLALRGQLEALGDPGVEELFSHTFDISPAVTLDVGFHLFGLAYKRGEFLVKATCSLAEHGMTSGTELPDHLPVLLDLAGAMNPVERKELIESCLAPAVRRMSAGFPDTKAGFGEVIHALDQYFCANFGCVDLYVPAPEDGYETMEEPETSLMF